MTDLSHLDDNSLNTKQYLNNKIVKGTVSNGVTDPPSLEERRNVDRPLPPQT